MQSIRRTRKGYSGRVTGNLVCFAQKESIKKIINASSSTGLCERFLMIAEPALGQKDHTKKIPDASELLLEYTRKLSFLTSIIEKPLSHDELITLHIPQEGWDKINLFRNELEPLKLFRFEFSHPIMKSMVNKVTLQIMSIASNLHLLECKTLPVHIGEHFIDIHYVTIPIEIVKSLLYSTREFLVKMGIIGNKEQLKAIVYSFVDKDLNFVNTQMNLHKLEQKKEFRDIENKRALIRNLLDSLIHTNNLILCTDGTYRLNPAVRLQ